MNVLHVGPFKLNLPTTLPMRARHGRQLEISFCKLPFLVMGMKAGATNEVGVLKVALSFVLWKILANEHQSIPSKSTPPIPHIGALNLEKRF